ncbi:Gnt-I system high-affinity gluconate transporter [Dyadobacter jejuensis]|uniref:Gnt-I system high-affinity gluconate transporter n=1 Tax=Dyadobacter jejuensis TaxID=1082580 RepID=A0A316ANP8_9BACT|nr:gluconate:H+ symporter [Dyadobacter jejuensis]PWJ58939.1 Gnt-I system high-affinity gluconate transporter [Dyadobacter jejuensis]
MPIVLTVVAILMLILLIAWLRIDTFISFLLVSIGLGFASGLEVATITTAIQKGVGNTLGELVLIVGFGAMLGKIVADSGAAQRITDALIGVFGKKNIQWGMAVAGFVIGIPLFYNAGFVIVIPLIFMISTTAGLPLLYVGIPMLSALSVAHGYLPPHPSPAAIASQLGADLGQTLLYGIIVSIPAIAVAGPIFGKSLKRFKPKPDEALFNVKPRPTEELPGLGVSLFSALLPVLLLTSMSAVKSQFPGNKAMELLAEPYFGMLLSVLVAAFTLGIRRGQSMVQLTKSMEDAFKGVSVILLIIAGSGVFKEMMTVGGVSIYIAEGLKEVAMSPLLLSWGIAAIIRVCVGSATVAGLTTVGILGPLLANTGVKPELIVLAIGSGSLMFSHLNDGGFWLFKEYFNLSIKDTLLTWSVMETIVSVMGLLGVLLLNIIL